METLFLLVVHAAQGGATLCEALEEMVRRVLGEVDAGNRECQLTAVVTDGEALAYVRTSNKERTNSLYRLEGGRLAPEGILLASERLEEDPGWASVPAHTIAEIGPLGERQITLDRS